MLKPIRFIVEEYEVSPLNGYDLERLDHFAHDIYAILSDEETLRFIPEKRLNNKEEAMQWLKLSILNFHSGRNYIHMIKNKVTGRIVGIIDILSPTLVKQYYLLPSYSHFVEFYIKGEYQGGSLMSKVLPKILQVIEYQQIDVISAVADRKNFAARKVLAKSGFAEVGPFDSNKDLFNMRLESQITASRARYRENEWHLG
jgi:RimJ/RimL family protein N-acetyltransferase